MTNITYLYDGTIIQYGYFEDKTWNVPRHITFQPPFPNTCFYVSVTSDRRTSGGDGYNHASNLTRYGFDAVIEQKDYELDSLGNLNIYDTGHCAGWWMAWGK